MYKVIWDISKINTPEFFEKKKKEIEEYFEEIKRKVYEIYEIAKKAREKGLDPKKDVEVLIAKNRIERIQAIISVAVPKLKDAPLAKEIEELEKQYGPNDWRVALKLAEFVAKGKYCKWDSIEEAVDAGLRAGMAYLTMGIVTMPIDGIVGVKLKDRMDGKGKYLAIYVAGPVRAAGGTAAAFVVVLADYLRKVFNLPPYDPTKEEVERYWLEIQEYNNIQRLQYMPYEEEAKVILSNLPVEVSSPPGEKTAGKEVAGYRDLPRVETNEIREGAVLVLAEGLCQKAKKIVKNLKKWGKDFGLDHWLPVLEKAMEIRKKIAEEKIKSSESSGGKEVKSTIPRLPPDVKYLEKLVVGRPVLSDPSAKGGFRLRYGRARTNTMSACCLHPATMEILDEFVAIGTQIALERPSKAAVVTPCSLIEGPIVRLKDGSVIRVESYEQAKKIRRDIDKILFLGDILFPAGEFRQQGHVLVPAAWTEEWYALILKEKVDDGEIPYDEVKDILEFPWKKIDQKRAVELSKKYKIPLHPRYTYFWHDISKDELLYLIKKLKNYEFDGEKVIVDFDPILKKILEEICIPHKLSEDKKKIIIDEGLALLVSLGLDENNWEKLWEKANREALKAIDTIDLINRISSVEIKVKAPVYVGARVGRPEKSKMRQLKGRPNMLFPVGQQGGKSRDLVHAVQKYGYVEAEVPIFICPKCGHRTLWPKCEKCGSETIQWRICPKCGKLTREERCPRCNVRTKWVETRKINVKELLELAEKNLGIKRPTTIRGVRGMTSEKKIPERLEKGILRALYGLYVNKDGTVRFDAIEAPITHFKPKEIGVSIEKLKELGYTHDIYGNPLVSEDQIVELKPQDVILPDPEGLGEEKSAAAVFVKVAQYIDDLLEKFYGLPRYYNVKSKEDLVGHIVFLLAPHTSSAVAARIIGFSRTQCIFAHPALHAAIRRNCFHPETYVYLIKDGKLIFEKIGEIVEKIINNKEYKEIKQEGDVTLIIPKEEYFSITFNPYTRKVERRKVKYFIKRPDKKWVKIKLSSGKEIIVTEDHPVVIFENGEFRVKLARELKVGDLIPVLANGIEIKEFINEEIPETIDLYEFLKDRLELECDDGYVWLKKGQSHKVKRYIKIDEDLMWLFGLYVAEGFIHETETTFQVVFRNFDEGIIEKIKRISKEKFGVEVRTDEEGRYLICSKIVIEFFKKLGFGRKFEEKDIPNWIFKLDEEKISAFIAGIIDGDGSISYQGKLLAIYSANFKLINKLSLLLSYFGILCYWRRDENRFGRKILERYKELGKEPPKSIVYRIGVYSKYLHKLLRVIYRYLASRKKREEATKILDSNYSKPRKKIQEQDNLFLESIETIEIFELPNYSYCFSLEADNLLEKLVLIQENIITHNCDGDEASLMLGLDVFLNFSREYLPAKRGGLMDAPIVLTLRLELNGVDTECHDVDVVPFYPKELYEKSWQLADPKEVNIEHLEDRIGKENEWFDHWFTIDTDDINNAPTVSAYKRIKVMMLKLLKMLELAEKIRAVDENRVAEIIINGHFLKDVKGNLRKFGMQKFRCINCNEKFRRMPLRGRCPKCGGRIVLTVSEGFVKKYLGFCLWLVKRYKINPYLAQSVELVARRVEQLFGKEQKTGTLDKILKISRKAEAVAEAEQNIRLKGMIEELKAFGVDVESIEETEISEEESEEESEKEEEE